jgi:hypothetical protein
MKLYEVEIAQYLLSLVTGSFFIITNIIHGWGSFEAQKIAVPIFILYNVVDIMMGKYWQNNILYLIHHISIIILGIYFYNLKEEFTDEQYAISYYISLGEVSTIFNNIRYFYSGTFWHYQTNLLFAISFIIFRSISNIGLINYSWQYGDGIDFGSKLIQTITVVYTLLNLYWGYKISQNLIRNVLIQNIYNDIKSYKIC